MVAEAYGYIPYTVNQRIEKTLKNYVENHFRIFGNITAGSLSAWSVALDVVAPHLDPEVIVQQYKNSTGDTGRIDFVNDFMPWFQNSYPNLLERHEGGVSGSYWTNPNNYNKPFGFMDRDGTTVAGFGND